MFKALFALPLLTAFTMNAATAQTAATTGPSINAPAEIAADPANRLTLELSNGGKVVIVLRPDLAPAHVKRIQTLVSRGFYDGTPFHRVIPGFMAQGGDPTGTGNGGSDLPDLKAEFTSIPHLRGTVSAARTADSRDSGNSQFYIMFAPSVSLDNKYTVFGRVVEGMAAVDSIAPGEPPAEPTRIVRASLAGPPPALEVATAPAPPATVATPAPPVTVATPADTATAAPAAPEAAGQELPPTEAAPATEANPPVPPEPAPAEEKPTPQN